MAAKTRLAGGETGKDISGGAFVRKQVTSMSRTTCRRLCELDPWRNRTALAADLRALAVDGGQIIVRQFPPLLFDLAFDLFPIPFNTIPVHAISSRVARVRQRLNGRRVPSVGRNAVPLIDPVGTKADASD